MENKTFFQLTLLTGGLLLLATLVLLLLSPILALVFVVFVALVVTILLNTWPRFRAVLTLQQQKISVDIKNRVRDATKGGTEELDTSFHPEYELVFTRHGHGSRTVISKETMIIGRKKTCDLTIPDASISKEHCRIVYRKYSHAYFIEDLNSDNGTYLGVRRLEPFTQEKLLENAEITISDRVYRFQRIGN